MSASVAVTRKTLVPAATVCCMLRSYGRFWKTGLNWFLMTNIVTVMGFCVCNLGVPKSLAITVIYSHKTLSRSTSCTKIYIYIVFFSINCITNDKWSSYCIDHTFKSCEIYLILSVGERIGVLCEWPSDRDLTSAWVQEEIVQGLGRSCSYVFHTVWTSLCKQKIYIYTTGQTTMCMLYM